MTTPAAAFATSVAEETAMPTWAGALESDQLWGLAYYVRSIAILRGTPEGKALKDKLLAAPMPKAEPPGNEQPAPEPEEKPE